MDFARTIRIVRVVTVVSRTSEFTDVTRSIVQKQCNIQPNNKSFFGMADNVT